MAMDLQKHSQFPRPAIIPPSMGTGAWPTCESHTYTRETVFGGSVILARNIPRSVTAVSGTKHGLHWNLLILSLSNDLYYMYIQSAEVWPDPNASVSTNCTGIVDIGLVMILS